MSQENTDILLRTIEREKAARKAAEKILESKSLELYHLSEELKKSNAKLETLLDEKSSQLEGVFENIVDAYVVIDLQGNVIKFNEAAIELFGYDINKEPLNVMNLVYKDDIEYAISSFTNLQEKGFFKNYEARIYTKNNQVKWVHINASVVLDKNKKPIATQGIVRDITDAKNSDEKLKES
jgi:PAS domain S-box-containing protein